MEKRIRIGIIIAFIIICLDVLVLGNDSVEENRESILTDNNMIDLGNHIVAYRTSSDVIDTDYKGDYIAIHDLNTGEIFYLPNVYEEVYKMTIEDNESIFISYSDIEHHRIQAVYIPVYFSSQANDVYEVDRMETKILTEARGNISAATAALPKLIWKEKISSESGTYEITFERKSLAYKSLIWETGGLFADYCLTVKDGEDNVISKQIMVNYPVKYEEVYWFRDFSGDGFPDIAFCTNHYFGKESYTHLEFMIWNAEENTYETKPLPVRWTELPVWNERQSSVISFYGGEECATLGMYSFHNGEWELVAELLPVYEKSYTDEYGNLLCDEWKEIFYESGEAVEKNRVIIEETNTPLWHDEDNIWCKHNKENRKLYPEMEWKEVEVIIGEDSTHKYVKIQDEESKEDERNVVSFKELGQTAKGIYSPHSIYDKDYYDSYRTGKFMCIRFQEENLQEDLEAYFEVGSYAEGPEILADMFLDRRTIEMDEEELKKLFYQHGYLLYLHHKEVDDLHIRLVEVQEIGGLSLYPIRIAIQTWDEKNIYVEDITAPIPRKIRDFLIIDNGDALRMIIHSSGVSVDYVAEEELSFWEFMDNGNWDLTPMDLEIDTSHAHNTGDGYPDLNRDELFPAVYYQDGITFGSSRQGNMRANGLDTFRLGKLEEIEKNKSFRLIGIYEILGRTYVYEYGNCYIQFSIL